MVVEKILKKIKEIPKKTEELVEIESSEVGEKKVDVRIENLKTIEDTDRIQQMLREGSVIFLRIRDLREEDISELKRAVDKLRKTCTAMNGDIVGVDEDYIILTPSFAKIFRGKAA